MPSYPLPYDVAGALNKAARAVKESGFGAQWAGQGAPLVRTGAAAELTEVLAAELFQ